jgi:hypothetical protein
MKAFILLCAATLAWPIFVNAETVTTTDGRTITLNEDGTYVIEAGTTSKVDDYVTLLDAFLEDHTSQYDEQSIRFMPKLRNEAESAIVGVRFTATFHDAFGDEIFKLEGDMNERIAPGASSTANVFYVFKNNPFIAGEAYDRLLPMVRGNTGSTVTMITGLALADGEVVSF